MILLLCVYWFSVFVNNKYPKKKNLLYIVQIMNNSKQLCKSSPNQVQFKTISRLQEWLHYKICAFEPFFSNEILWNFYI